MTPGSIDLHLHSTASDGRLSPTGLFEHAFRCGVRLAALTDHDTTAGVDEAATAARRLGMGFLPGVELSVSWRGRSIHVLGLGIDPTARLLRQGLARLGAERQRRAAAIAARLDRAAAPGSEALRRIEAQCELPTRTHFARALVELGAARSLAEAFDRYLGRGRPGAVPSRWLDLAEALDSILGAGGMAVLAHPLRYPLSAGARRELAAEFRRDGGLGLEVVCGGASAAQVAQSTALAQRAGLVASVGSDFHDPRLPWNPPGRLAKLPSAIPAIWDAASFPRALA